MASMRLGAIISFIGVAIAIAPISYFLTLSTGDPMRQFLTQPILALPLILYFTIAGGAVTAFGLILFIKAARAPPEVSSPSIVRRPIVAQEFPPPQPPRRIERPIHTSRKRPGEIVAEIEREIEEIVQSEGVKAEEEEKEEVVGEEVVEEKKPEIEVITRGQDIVCPNCGELNKLGSTKCVKCKKPFYKLEKEEPTCPVCGAPLRMSKRISDERFVCGLCFSELKIPPDVQQELGL